MGHPVRRKNATRPGSLSLSSTSRPKAERSLPYEVRGAMSFKAV